MSTLMSVPGDVESANVMSTLVWDIYKKYTQYRHNCTLSCLLKDWTPVYQATDNKAQYLKHFKTNLHIITTVKRLVYPRGINHGDKWQCRQKFIHIYMCDKSKRNCLALKNFHTTSMACKLFIISTFSNFRYKRRGQWILYRHIRAC